MIVRGADDRGDTLLIHRDYISHGMRERAAELVTIELGPQSEHEGVPQARRRGRRGSLDAARRDPAAPTDRGRCARTGQAHTFELL
jgi:type IV secretory pathway VirD2 relaxase